MQIIVPWWARLKWRSSLEKIPRTGDGPYLFPCFSPKAKWNWLNKPPSYFLNFSCFAAFFYQELFDYIQVVQGLPLRVRIFFCFNQLFNASSSDSDKRFLLLPPLVFQEEKLKLVIILKPSAKSSNLPANFFFFFFTKERSRRVVNGKFCCDWLIRWYLWQPLYLHMYR